MKVRQNRLLKEVIATAIGWSFLAVIAARADTQVTVNDITDWGTTPVEQISADLPYLGYDGGGILAGINTLSVNNGTSTTIYNGFCIDPFHWSASGPVSTYYEVPLSQAPKSPATLNGATALDIEELWAEFYSPTMTSAAAAGLQIAIWELVSSNAVASDGLSPSQAFVLTQPNDYGASADLATLAGYDGPVANLVGLTGPGQDYVIQVPLGGGDQRVPDGGATFLMLVLTVAGLIAARPALQKSQGRMQKVRVRS